MLVLMLHAASGLLTGSVPKFMRRPSSAVTQNMCGWTAAIEQPPERQLEQQRQHQLPRLLMKKQRSRSSVPRMQADYVPFVSSRGGNQQSSGSQGGYGQSSFGQNSFRPGGFGVHARPSI